MHLANYIVFYAILFGCGVASAVKGHYVLAAFGVVLPIMWIVGAVKTAKPGSIWSEHFGAPQSTIKDAGPDWIP
jgi:hypothetical protein